MKTRHLSVLVLCLGLVRCGGAEPGDPGLDELDHLPLGEMPEIKADGWGMATTCKPIPQVAALADPAITISLDGLTLRLEDRAGSYDETFPVGVGTINHSPGETTQNESRTLYPVLRTEQSMFSIDTGSVNPCTIWWHDKASGKNLPVFAGLPFMSFYGPYGIHGPVTGYTAPSGGRLKRGYVSHGCVRMEGPDVAEVWARIRATTEVPVRVQKATERTAGGDAVELEQRWILSECQVDADCNFDGGVCRKNPFSGRGFCTAPCQRLCHYDRYGYPVTFCVSEPGDSEGYCTYKASDFNYDCRRFSGFVREDDQPRFSQPAVTADVCTPGSQGWIGDRCLSSADCGGGRTCQAVQGASFGFCTEACALYCPDAKGRAGTFCVAGKCRARCELDDNGATCPVGFVCSTEQRFNQPTVSGAVCMPAPQAPAPQPPSP
jgi:hypothetical protein